MPDNATVVMDKETHFESLTLKNNGQMPRSSSSKISPWVTGLYCGLK